MSDRKILVLGHPRGGTGYTANLLQSCGLDVGHEKIGKNGFCSWKTITNPLLIDKLTEYDTLIHVIRDPVDTINSFMLTGAYRNQNLLLNYFLPEYKNKLCIENEQIPITLDMYYETYLRLHSKIQRMASIAINKGLKTAVIIPGADCIERFKEMGINIPDSFNFEEKINGRNYTIDQRSFIFQKIYNKKVITFVEAVLKAYFKNKEEKDDRSKS